MYRLQTQANIEVSQLGQNVGFCTSLSCNPAQPQHGASLCCDSIQLHAYSDSDETAFSCWLMTGQKPTNKHTRQHYRASLGGGPNVDRSHADVVRPIVVDHAGVLDGRLDLAQEGLTGSMA